MITTGNNFDSVDSAVILAQLFQTQLELDDLQVMLYNQKWDIPSDERLYVVVAQAGQKVFGVQNLTFPSVVDVTGTSLLMESVSCNVQEQWLVYIFSKGPAARLRVAELAMALSSVQSQQLQEQYSMKFATLPDSTLDMSHEEGMARIFQFGIRFSTLRAYEKTRVIDYFDKFNIPPEIHTNQ